MECQVKCIVTKSADSSVNCQNVVFVNIVVDAVDQPNPSIHALTFNLGAQPITGFLISADTDQQSKPEATTFCKICSNFIVFTGK